MPEDQCCFKKGPLLGKALAPEAPELSFHKAVTIVPACFYQGLHAGLTQQAEHLCGTLRPTPTQPLLQTFRI